MFTRGSENEMCGPDGTRFFSSQVITNRQTWSANYVCSLVSPHSKRITRCPTCIRWFMMKVIMNWGLQMTDEDLHALSVIASCNGSYNNSCGDAVATCIPVKTRRWTNSPTETAGLHVRKWEATFEFDSSCGCVSVAVLHAVASQYANRWMSAFNGLD